MASARLHFYTHVVSDQVEEVVEFSDTCGGQNRSRYLSAMMCNVLEKSTKINKFTQKFFESGHSQSEVDTMHSSLEGRLRDKQIFKPEEWLTETRNCGDLSGKKYKVYALGTDEAPIYDTKQLWTDVGKNKDWAECKETGNRVKGDWMNAKKIAYGGYDDNFVINMHNTFSSSDQGRELNLRGRPKKQTRLTSSQQHEALVYDLITLQVKSDSNSVPLSIDKDKFGKLQKLCVPGKYIIPKEYHIYYNSLRGIHKSKKRPDVVIHNEDIDE